MKICVCRSFFYDVSDKEVHLCQRYKEGYIWIINDKTLKLLSTFYPLGKANKF